MSRKQSMPLAFAILLGFWMVICAVRQQTGYVAVLAPLVGGALGMFVSAADGPKDATHE